MLCHAVKNSTWLRINMVQDKYKRPDLNLLLENVKNGLWWLRSVSQFFLLNLSNCLSSKTNTFLKMADESLYILCGMIQYTGFKFYIFANNLSDEFAWTLGGSGGQGSLACCSPWGVTKSRTQLGNWTPATTMWISMRVGKDRLLIQIEAFFFLFHLLLVVAGGIFCGQRTDSLVVACRLSSCSLAVTCGI